jgi:hypothetical protein
MRPRTSIALVVLTGAIGCGTRDTAGRGRVWTLFDVVAAAATDGRVAVGSSIADGFPGSYFVRPSADPGAGPDEFRLAPSLGFLNGLPMITVTTELWANVDEVWAQPMYRAIDDKGAVIDDPTVKEPWVFGVGPRGHFYSPFWQVYGFQVPEGTDVTTLLDTRAVLEAANRTGGLRTMERRITSLGPGNVEPPAEWVENSYYDDTAAWDGVGDRRYLDLGPGRFDVDDDAVVREIPLFFFAKRNDGDQLQAMLDWRNVGGTQPLFSAPPALSSGTASRGVGGSGGASSPPPPVDIEPNFGGLWRIHIVELPATASTMADGRAVLNRNCLDGSRPCVVLDSQTAIESLGGARIHRTELLAAGPLLQVGDKTFPTTLQNPPLPLPP